MIDFDYFFNTRMGYCINSSTFLSTPEFQKLTLHYLGFVAIPVHVFGAYCILCKSPVTMNSVKWNLFNFHFWNCFCDLMFSLLVTPYMLFPAFAMKPLGFLSFLGAGGAEQLFMIVAVIAIVLVSVIALFENRLLVLLDRDHWWRSYRIYWLSLDYLVAILCFVPFYIILPDHKVAVDFFLNRWTCAPQYINLDDVFFVATETRFSIRTISAIVVFFFIQIFVFHVLISKVLKKQIVRHVSNNTAKLQQKFQKALLLQLLIPVIIVMFPLVYLAFSNWFWFHYQYMNNICMIILSSHGFLSTIVMVLVHGPYREFAKSLTSSFGTRIAHVNLSSIMQRGRLSDGPTRISV